MKLLQVYFIRHGLAGKHGSYEDDTQRPLTPEGQKKTRRIAKRLRDLQLQFDRVLTSPLIRAKQTADILQEVGLTANLEVVDFLAPGGAIQDWVRWLDAHHRDRGTLALVGHEPDLSTWAETLIWGRCQGNLTLKKAGVIGVELPETGSPVGSSTLFWLAPPRFLL